MGNRNGMNPRVRVDCTRRVLGLPVLLVVAIAVAALLVSVAFLPRTTGGGYAITAPVLVVKSEAGFRPAGAGDAGNLAELRRVDVFRSERRDAAWATQVGLALPIAVDEVRVELPSTRLPPHPDMDRYTLLNPADLGAALPAIAAAADRLSPGSGVGARVLSGRSVVYRPNWPGIVYDCLRVLQVVAVGAGAVALWRLVIQGRRERGRLAGGEMCAGCGYSLQGLGGHRCPECGRVRGPAA